MKLEKLITEYQNKIAAEDIAITAATTDLQIARRLHNQTLREIATEDRREAQIKRQAYVQFVKDLEDLRVVEQILNSNS